MVGYPEAAINLAQAVILLASAPKSNAAFLAYAGALEDIRNRQIDDVPLHLKDGHSQRAKEKGIGKTYLYPHDFGGYVAQQYLPDNLADARYYTPTQQGAEAKIAEAKRRRDALAADWKKSQK